MAYYRDSAGKFDCDSEQFLDIFAEFDFTDIEDGCDGFCPECELISKCENYQEIKDEWDSFYT